MRAEAAWLAKHAYLAGGASGFMVTTSERLPEWANRISRGSRQRKAALPVVETQYRCDFCGRDYTDSAMCCERRKEYLDMHRQATHPAPALTAGEREALERVEAGMATVARYVAGGSVTFGGKDIRIIAAALRRLAPGVTG